MDSIMNSGFTSANLIRQNSLRPLTHKIDRRVPLKNLYRNLYACWYFGNCAEVARTFRTTEATVNRRLRMLERETGKKITQRKGHGFHITEDGLALIERYIKWGKSPLLMRGC